MELLKRLSFRAILERILDRPVAVLLAVVGVSVFFAWHIPNLSFRTSIYDLVIQDLPETSRYEEFKKIFGSDEIIQVVIKGKNIYDPVTFGKVEQLAQTASDIGGVKRVISMPGIRKSVDIGGKWSLDEFANVAGAVALFQRNLISEDRSTTVLNLILEDGADKNGVISAVEEMIVRESGKLSLYQIGMPLVSQALAEFTEKDFFRLPPITFLLIALVLFFLFRNLSCLLLPLASVALALLWTFGLMAWTGTAMSMLTMIVPVFLIAVGTAYCLHLISDYITRAEESASRRETVFATLSTLSLPTALAVLTTSIGIGSLLVNRIVAIREFAIFSCFGIISLLVLLLTFFPSVLMLVPLPKKKVRKSTRGRLFSRFIELVITLNLKHQRVVLPVLGIVVVICLAGMLRLKIQTNPIGYFKESTPVSRHFHDIYQDMSGSFPINVFMNGSTEDYFEDPGHVADIARFQNFVETLPEVDKTISFADYLKLVNYVLNRFNPEYYALPTQAYQVRMLINNYKIILGEEMLTRFMNPDFSGTNILLLTHISSSRGFLRTRDLILEHVHKELSRDIRWDVTGFGIVLSASSHLITSGQVKSLSLTVVLVFGIMFLLFLSSKVGLIAIVPNLFPIVINFGIMGWFGIELSMVTSLIASIAIGLAVDDTIHYLVRYNIEFKKNLDDKGALADTLRHVGRPIVFTSLTISLGFSVLAFSSFNPTAVFGVMMVITMLSALVGDLILLPSLMQHVELVTIWDLLRLKLGKAPELGIPLFRGLSHTQLHYILMAGALRKSEAGEILFRKGDPSDSMYAVISGGMDVVDHPKDEDPSETHGIQKLISHIVPGDLVGEMGLLRSAPRSATVIVTEPSELLQVNWKMLKRLQWLYPPAAHKLFYNLMAFLCDRLQQTTECLSETSHVDDLTGFYDRNDFLKILEIETYRARRYGTDISLCLMWIEFRSSDHRPNEHAKDRLLRLLGKTLSSEVRECDTLARLDARTFALLLPQTSAPEARPISDRLRRMLQGPDFRTETLRMTIKTGVAGLNVDSGDTSGELLANAVKALEAGEG